MRIGKQYTYMTLRNRFFNSGRKKDIASFDELTIFFKKHRSPTAMYLIARAANNLANFQAVVVKKRLSKFELFKCFCKILQQRSQTNFVSNRELFKCCSELRLQRSLQYSFARKGMPFFGTTRLRHLVLTKSTTSLLWQSNGRAFIHDITIPNSDTRCK